MTEISIQNIDETLKTLRIERAEIERKTKARDEEYKRATKLYIKSLQKETEAFERNRPNYDKRNQSFLEEVHGVMDRFRIGAFGLLKTRERLHKEIDNLNNYLLEHYPKLATQVKIQLEKEREDLEMRLKKIKEENEKNPVNEFNLRIPSANLLDIRERRQELERDLRSGAPDYAYLKDFKDDGYIDRLINLPARQTSPFREKSPIRQKSPYRSLGYLDEFIIKANPEIEVVPSKPPTTRIERRSVTPNYVVEKEIVGSRVLQSHPQTDMLSEFYYKEVPNVIFSPTKLNNKGVSPNRSESLLYSPFSAAGGIDTESRFSRPSSMKKGQRF